MQKKAFFIKPRALSLAALIVCAAGAVHAQGTLQSFAQNIYSVSADGKTAVMGTTNTGAVSMIDVGTGTVTNIGGFVGSGGRALISADGSAIAGAVKDASNNYVSARYDVATHTWTALPTLGGSASGTATSTWSISADGRYIGGFGYAAGSTSSRGYLVDTQTGQTTNLVTTGGRVQGISPNASMLFGQLGGSAGSVWNRNGDGSYTQTTLTAPEAPGQALNILGASSNNGLWATGASFNTTLPYRVNAQTGEIQYMAKLNVYATPGAISEDGQTVIGRTSPQGGTLAQSTAYIWRAAATDTPGDNMVDGTVVSLHDYLAGYGIDTANQYSFLSGVAMNADATVFAFIGLNKQTQDVMYFIATVPEPSQYALLAAGLGVVGLLARRRRKTAD